MSLNTLRFAQGSRVRFVRYNSASFEYPNDVKPGDEAMVMSARQPDQGGFDYWLQFDNGHRYAFSDSELEPAP